MLQSVWASLTKHASGDVSQFVDLGMDALAVLGHGHRQLCLHRRELIKPHLSRQYVHLCSPSVPFTNQLFGSDVDTLIENITNTNKVSNKLWAKRRIPWKVGLSEVSGSDKRQSKCEQPESRKALSHLQVGEYISLPCIQFEAGRLKYFVKEWESLTSEPSHSFNCL